MSVTARLAIAERAPRIYPAGRHCEREGCETVLSIYNPGALCSSCLPIRPPIRRRAHA
jgi:hypothetical protein